MAQNPNTSHEIAGIAEEGGGGCWGERGEEREEMARGERGSSCSAGVCTHHTVLIYQVCVKRKIINYSSLRQWNGHSRQRASTMWSWVPVALLSDREQDWGEHVHCPPKATRDWTRPSPTPGRTLLQIGGGACKDCKLSLSGSHRNGGHQSVQGVVVVVLRVDLHGKFALQLHERDPLEGHDARAERAGVLKRRTAIRVKPWPNGTQAKLQNQNLSLIKFKATRSNSSQVGGQTIPNSIQVVNLARLGLSWEDRLARALDRWKIFHTSGPGSSKPD